MIVIGLCLALLSSPADAGRRRVLAGPVVAHVMRVVDGDTIAVRAQVWIGQSVEVLVRVRGIDAPERKGRCAAERHLAVRASAYVRAMTASGRVVLTDISGGKYFGRVLADVATSEGNDVADTLLGHRLARPYQGRKRHSWCRRADNRGAGPGSGRVGRSGAANDPRKPVPVKAGRLFRQ